MSKKQYRKVRNPIAQALLVNSPYKPRVIRNKKAYSRKIKHREG